MRFPRSRLFSTPAGAAGSRPPTAVVMMNMGGPATIPEVGPFLSRLFKDKEIIDFGPFQNILGPWISKRRTPKIEKQYETIGGSPIRKWTDYQGERMAKRLDELSPETAPHKHYTCFRYADPLTEEVLQAMKADGVTRAVAFSQYPQYSCTTAGSSFNHLWRESERLGMEKDFVWSVIDRWPTQPTFIKAMAQRIKLGLEKVAEEVRDKTVIMFSAHSLPIKVVSKGDQYVPEVAATAMAVMQELKMAYPYILCWQSQVGPLPWQGPQTGEALKALGKAGHVSVLTVPIAFTSDHIETLFEVDIEYMEEAHEAGIKHFHRAPALNEEPLFIEAQAEMVAAHLKHGQATDGLQYSLNCPTCTNTTCRSILNPVAPYQNMRSRLAGEKQQ